MKSDSQVRFFSVLLVLFAHNCVGIVGVGYELNRIIQGSQGHSPIFVYYLLFPYFGLLGFLKSLYVKEVSNKFHSLLKIQTGVNILLWTVAGWVCLASH